MSISRARNSSTSDRLLTNDEVAKRLGISVDTVERWTRRGDLPGLKLGGSRKVTRYSEKALDEWITRQPKTGT